METPDQDYLSVYRLFFEYIYQSLDMAGDPLPVHIGKYNVAEFEIVGEIICWCLEYLNIRKCPPSLIAPLCRSVMAEMEVILRKDPESCGYRQEEDDYQTLKLMQVTIQKLNEVCSRYRDNSEVSRLPPPPPVPPSISTAAVKNGRRTMEDCHIIINDLHALFGIQGYGVASYYAVFDGHIGSDAAIYSCSHVYQYLIESPSYPQNPEAAFKEAFIKTDERFIKKSNKENLKSGTTAVSVLIRHDLGKLYVAWVGDSQAILVNGRDFIQLVNPHRPEHQEERERIERMGGSVVFWGTWRVNGQLAVSRAIGDVDYKPYVSAEADVCSYELSGDEDFLLLACDGLWDFLSEKEVIEVVYKSLEENKGDRSRVSKSLVHAAKSLGSKDNISVVVAWLDMSTLENGHFPECRDVAAAAGVDSMDDLPPVLRSLKPATQANTSPHPRLDRDAEQWLKTLPWSYADALKQPAPKKVEHPPKERPPAQGPSKTTPEPAKVTPESAKTAPEPPQAAPEPPKTTSEQPKSEPSKLPEVAETVHKGEELGAEVGGEGDSGEDSDEEWNYISGKENRQPNQHNKQELSEEDMESQLNPNAAEFVPTYGTKSPILEPDLVDISHSPTRTSELRSLEKVKVPSAKEFLKEIAKRPSDIDELGENDKTLNGDLNDISTKAVYGDDSECFNETVDTNIIQNESLKSTNPFASSQVPNFVQDHFSADFGFKPLNDSKSSEFDFIGVSTDSGVAESPQEVSTGLDVDERPCQDSPLLRESPEPGLHNGQMEHEASSPEVEDDKVVPLPAESAPERAASPVQHTHDQLPVSSPIESTLQAPPSLFPEPVLSSTDQGPETCVDSESEDDVLVSPSKTVAKIQSEEKFNKGLLTEEREAGDDDEFISNLLSKGEVQEYVIEGMTPASFINQFEEQVGVDLNSKENKSEISSEKEEKDLVHVSFEATPMSAEQVILDQSPLPVEEVCSRLEVHEDLISSGKEILLEETHKQDDEQNLNEIVEIKSEINIIGVDNKDHNIGVDNKESVEVCHRLNEPDIVHHEESKLDEILEQCEPEIRYEEDELDRISQKLNEEVDLKEEESDEIHHKQETMHDVPVVNGIEHNAISGLHEEKSSVNEFDPLQDDQVCSLRKEENDEESHNKVYEDIVCPFKSEENTSLDKEEKIPEVEESLNDMIFGQLKEEPVSNSAQISERLEEEDFICPIKKVICPMKKVNNVELKSDEDLSPEDDRPCSPADFSKIGLDYPAQMPMENILRAELDTESKEEFVCEKTILAESFTRSNVVEACSFKTVQEVPVEVEIFSYKNEENNLQEDEMSSSMIDHGEEKLLPEAQSNQLNIVQDLQFEVHERNEPDTESDSGFEIINASEASTIEMEMRIQSEKEAGAIDEKLLLDKNEADVEEQAPAVDKESLVKEEQEVDEVKAEEAVPEPSAPIEAVVNGGTVTPPATPPATPAPGFEVEHKEELLSSAVAAAGIATVVAGAAAVTAAAVSAEPKVEDKKKPASPKKAEPTGKLAPAKPGAKAASTKPTAPAKAPATKAPLGSVKSAAKPSSPATKTALSSAKPAGTSTKPSTPTTKVAARPASKPSTPTTAKPPAASSPLKSKPTSTVPSAKPAGTAMAKPAAAKPAATALKKPPTPVSSTAKPPTAAGKPAAPSKPAATSTVKLAAKPATTAAKPAVSSSALKSAPPKPAASKAPVSSSTTKAPISSSRPSSAKSTTASKPLVSSTATKAPAKPAVGLATKPSSSAKPATATTAKAPVGARPSTTATKPASGPNKAAPAAPLSKKPAAPTAIKKPAAPTDKSVKEANNKLASAKTKKVEEKKIVSKKEEIIVNVEPLTQEPIITTTNGHISHIENGIPSPEILTEVN